MCPGLRACAVYGYSLAFGGGDFSIASQVMIQAEAVAIIIAWSAVVAFIAYKIVDLLMGLRVPEEEDRNAMITN